jgi:XTP/dITP diphosphohydrolase
MRLILASNNAKKLVEIRGLLTGLPFDLVAQSALHITEADEPHPTFIENALAKARHAALAADGAAIADDSGLCVAALGGEPGVQSAHFAGLVADTVDMDREQRRARQDAANNALLLDRMAAIVDRRAHYICTLVAVRHAADPEPLIACGRWSGEVMLASRGDGGFGYDPLIWMPEHGASVAELPAELKNAVSHRALAMTQMRQLMADVWGLQ